MSENQLVKWDEELAKYAQKAAAMERPAVGRIAFRGGTMTYQGQPIPGNKLPVIILARAKEHALFKNVLENRQFNPSQVESPICFALSLNDEDEMIPHADAVQKMSPGCTNCQYNAWGSNPNGGRGKACKESRRLVVLPQSAVLVPPAPGMQLQSAPVGSVKKAEAATCSIPATSIKNWANYTAQLLGEYRRPSWAMVTEMSLHPHPKNQFEIKFAPLFEVPMEHIPELHQRVQTAESIVMTPYSPPQANAQPQQPMQNRRY